MSLSLFLAGVAAGAGFVAGRAHRNARKEAAILLHLDTHGPDYGLGMVNAGLGYRGTIYVRLHQMEQRGLIESREDWTGGAVRGGRPRRIYQITDTGRAALRVEAARQPTRRIRP